MTACVRWVCTLICLVCLSTTSGAEQDFARNTAALIAPEKLATLGPRGANPRIQKAVAQLEAARASGLKVEKIAVEAVALAGYRSAAAKLTADALVRNHDIAMKLGCLNAAGLADMRRGKSPTILRGPYRGQELSVDHIIPRSVAPELDNVIANLELLPLKLNQKKNDTVGDRQLSLAQKLYEAGLLSAKGLRKTRNAGSVSSAHHSWIPPQVLGFQDDSSQNNCPCSPTVRGGCGFGSGFL